MEKKLFDHSTLYDDGSEFFRLKGNASMKLSPKAAIEVCQEATGLTLDSGSMVLPAGIATIN